MSDTLWYWGCNHSINPYFESYTQYKPLDNRDDTEVNGIGGITKPKEIGTFVPEMEDYTDKLHNIIFKNV